MEKVAIFIDGGYLTRVLKNYFDKVDIDYLKLSEELSKKIGKERLRTYYYNCLPVIRKDNPLDVQKHSAMQRFLSNLKRLPRFEVKLGELQIIGGKFRQKMVDVLISLDIIDICIVKGIGHLAIIAGDADFVPAIKKAKEQGAIVHLIYHKSSAHNELLDIVDELHPISEELINKCVKEKR